MAGPSRSSNIALESITLSTLALSTHNIAWSPDAELALGCEDSVYIFLPEFTSPPPPSPPPSSAEGGGSAKTQKQQHEDLRQFNDVTLRFPTMERRHPELNKPLFAAAGQDFPETISDATRSSAPITGMGGSLNHVVALAWSPCGLGRMRRSVLAVLTSCGDITVYSEGASGDGSLKVRGRNTRTLRSWVVPWAVGAQLRVPLAGGGVDAAAPFEHDDHITAFAWAADLDDDGNEGALLAYANDQDEVVVLSVQARHKAVAEPGDPGEWRVEEVARFPAEGPHFALDPTDPDYSPSGSSFSLSWSPWLNRDGCKKSSMIAYVARNYVGFRRVTMQTPWPRMETPEIDVSPVDSSGICLFLGSDAFVQWEDLIWTIDGAKVCRGLIATPARVQAFQLSFDSHMSASATRKHAIHDCGTTYPAPEESNLFSNPITGLVVHPPSLSQSTSTPAFTLVRLSATSENDDWHQTNLPLPPNPETHEREPRWAVEIEQSVQHQLPRTLAFQMIYSPGTAEQEGENDLDNDLDDDDDDEDLDYGSYAGSDRDDIAGLRGLDTADQVHTTRMRIWGLAASPGKGVTAVFVSAHSTLKPERITFGGIKCRVLFGRHVRTEDADALPPLKKLSTEAKTWEWMYGGGPPPSVPGVNASGDRAAGDTVVRRRAAPIARSRLCPFCETPIRPDGTGSVCANGHVFENCAATGIPITAPDISNTCAVCGSKCLKPAELLALAAEYDASSNDSSSEDKDGDFRAVVCEISHELCGGCGGKFIN